MNNTEDIINLYLVTVQSDFWPTLRRPSPKPFFPSPCWVGPLLSLHKRGLPYSGIQERPPPSSDLDLLRQTLHHTGDWTWESEFGYRVCYDHTNVKDTFRPSWLKVSDCTDLVLRGKYLNLILVVIPFPRSSKVPTPRPRKLSSRECRDCSLLGVV